MKKFLIVGDINNVPCKELFPLIKDGKVGLGSQGMSTMWFNVPDNYSLTGTRCSIDADGKKSLGISTICWVTNLCNHKRPFLVLKEHYSPERYPRYDNYDAIEVYRMDKIPMDYPGVMGVPITFLDKYNPDQFELLGITEKADYLKDLYIAGCEKYDRPYINGKCKYPRLLIVKKNSKL